MITLIAVIGAAVFDYGTYEATKSHAYSLFAIALAIRVALSVEQRPRLANTIAFGASLGLVGLIRATNLTILIFCALIGIERWGDLTDRGRTLLRRFDLLAIGTGVFLLVLLPQSAYWYRITGAWITNPYHGPGEHLDLLHPHLIGVLFSVRKGLFFWTPLLILATHRNPRSSAAPHARSSSPTIVYLPAAIWVVASWSIWWYGGSFGMRTLIDEMPRPALACPGRIRPNRGGPTHRHRGNSTHHTHRSPGPTRLLAQDHPQRPRDHPPTHPLTRPLVTTNAHRASCSWRRVATESR